MLNDQMMGLLNELAILFPAFILVFTTRGFFKAFIAKLMGDDTAQEGGFLTFNPLAHINFLSFLIMLFILFFIGGLFLGIFSRKILFLSLILLGARWTIHVPINESNFKRHTFGVVLTTLAGSLGNFILALLCFYFLKYFPFNLFPKYVFVTLIGIFGAIIDLAIFFGVLDLIPLPPFDGGRLLEFILPRSLHYVITWLQEYSFYIFLALFFLPGVSNVFFGFLNSISVFIKQGLWLLVF